MFWTATRDYHCHRAQRQGPGGDGPDGGPLERRWKELIREVPIQKGDFFQINPGCLHAIKGGTLILETHLGVHKMTTNIF